MNVLICGSRTFTNMNILRDSMNKIEFPVDDIQIISGGATGADTVAIQYAEENNFPAIIIKPEWDKYGKQAGMIRNKKLVALADVMIAFWDNQSKGTLNSIQLCQQKRIGSVIFDFNGNVLKVSNSELFNIKN